MSGETMVENVVLYKCPKCHSNNDGIYISYYNGVGYSKCGICGKWSPRREFTEVEVEEYYYKCRRCGQRINDIPENWSYNHFTNKLIVVCSHCGRYLGETFIGYS